ncbi:hypothetical protein GCM10011491_30890 [Brucella endophytica]|uniref:DUF2190 domain-containing protein n=1 Tax=Brucella endophytica TaxID=1963359 RepID=A0A916SJC9_9HYPH|nr:hypothetical protein [Brucella endophytica]GGB00511.1 hypothetical protein GCM10011491_30890 [Brucella endophytica]
MSYFERKRTITLLAGADLSASQYLFGVVGAAGVTVAAAGAVADGVIDSNPTAGQAFPFAIGDVVEIKLGATLAAGATVASDATGQAVTAAAGAQLGKLLEGGVAGDIVPMLWQKVA